MALSATTASSYAAKAISEPLNKHVSVFRMVGDAAYPTGGSTLPSGVKPVGSSFYGVAINTSGNWTNAYQWNNDTQKLMAFVTDTEAEVANATDLSADVIVFMGVFI